MSSLLFEREGNIGILTLNKPEVLNALSSAFISELHDKIRALKQENLSVLILTGVEKAFVAGANIKEMSALTEEQALQFAKAGHEAFEELEQFPAPVIAMINGFALGGGSELALACDFRFASSKAKLGQPEVGLGICPGFAGTQRLKKAVGPSNAKDLIFTARVITAEEALAMGYVDRVFAPEELREKTLEFARLIEKNSPYAVRMSKQAINAPKDQGYTLEQELFAKCFGEGDQPEGMKAFLEKRPAHFTK